MPQARISNAVNMSFNAIREIKLSRIFLNYSKAVTRSSCIRQVVPIVGLTTINIRGIQA